MKFLQWIRIYNLAVLFLFSLLFVFHFLNIQIDEINYWNEILCFFIALFTAGCLCFKLQLLYMATSDEIADSLYLVKKRFSFTKLDETKTRTISMIKNESDLGFEKQFNCLLRLENIFINEKMFLKKDLQISDVTIKMGLSVNQLSNMINSELNMNFRDYVNLMRIEYFEEKVINLEWEHFSFKDMVLASGFKSRTTCFRAFVKHTGKSPTQFLKLKV
ncbi:helix-turn-helix domain-containing protein [Flavobacterium sp. LHD-85]|uniref:helix-turn-helix domain-containing protein n=1 Tax=Flavobacterium sp. LHD-85 TaxID=3071410 RepID=UPI0027E02413|nr:helix-turn-helix domain-containing protein [Flavobacterium sp. LHD-85]MDQ6530957.1 helix-turn-helix domain-containing protein [Flavobacterium sp. LHD-85]